MAILAAMTKPRHRPALFLAAAGVLAVLAVVFAAAYLWFEQGERERAQARLSFYRGTLQAALERYRHLPFVLAADPRVIAGASRENLGALNRRLAAFAARTDLEAIYLMEPSGLTIAASNHDSAQGFLGQNYGFRPYVRDALAGQEGEFFAIGVTTQRPGYFLSAPVRDGDGKVAGVIAIKVDLSDLTAVWREGGERLFVSNGDGVVVLATDPAWLYRTLSPLSAEGRARVASGRQFGAKPLSPLDWSMPDSGRWNITGHHALHLAAPMQTLDWTLHILAPVAPALRAAWASVGAAIVALLILSATVLFLRGERMRAALSQSQAERRKLRAANAALEHEIAERRSAEARLAQTEEDLRRAGKLAALGQLSASVTHELGQPLSAMRNHLTAAEIAASPADAALVARITRLVVRMETITRTLRFFARPAPEPLGPVDLLRVWGQARDLVQHDIAAAGIDLLTDLPEQPVIVQGNAGRLEQVVVNLLRNAILALDRTEAPEIRVTLTPGGALALRDNGPGLNGRTMAELEEPFHTTRPSGEGMGLGLAISAAILREHGGRLLAEDTGGGARFVMELPLAQAREKAA
ncbi:sensor histidine kinase [Oceaniglobus trochenteri]|uniref:sensor histidine kinase n=1 Tax=Oceaniglobus trochenteri TaxID=2763260 RepID=UPI001D000A5F|nr:cache domain-containing protein [Oceaniglobus trochenteri]